MKKVVSLALCLFLSGCVVLDEVAPSNVVSNTPINKAENNGHMVFLDENLKQSNITFHARKKLPEKLKIDTRVGSVKINGNEFDMFYLRGDDKNEILTTTIFDDNGKQIQVSSSLGISVAGNLKKFTIYEYYKSKSSFEIQTHTYSAKMPICKAYKDDKVDVFSVENYYFGSNDFIAAISKSSLNYKSAKVDSVDFKAFTKQSTSSINKFTNAFKNQIAKANLEKHKARLINYICFDREFK